MVENKYKYVHLFTHNEYKFSMPVADMVNEKENNFNTDDFLFVAFYEKTYNALKNYPNVVMYNGSVLSAIKEYGKRADFIFVHALNASYFDVIKIPRKYAKKIIWRTWGHDMRQMNFKRGSILRRAAKRVVFALYRRKVRQFRLIGIANRVDVMMAEKLFGNVRTYPVSYGYIKGKKDIFYSVYNSMKPNDGFIRIMIGHSGYKDNRQIECMQYIEKFKDEDIRVSLLLPYGNEDVIQESIAYGTERFGDKLEVIDSFVPYEEYVKYISGVDIAILDMLGSSALGAVSLLLDFNKKIFFNRDGALHKGYVDLNVGHYCTDEIKDMSFEEFKKPMPDRDVLRIFDEQYSVDLWHILLDDLEKNK